MSFLCKSSIIIPIIFFLISFKNSYGNIHEQVKKSDDIHEHIFRIENLDTILTGFRLHEKKGIITALHGVAGGKSISASNNLEGYDNLEIIAVDIDHDLALLSSDKIKNKNGLKTPTEPVDYTGLHIVGYPFSLKSPIPSWQINIRNLIQLKELIPSGNDFKELLDGLIKRNSPSMKKDVLSIEGHLLPGHSGAPILNGKNEVVGVADGGLKGGSVGISWAIPYNKDIKWDTPSLNKLEHLAALPILFSYSVFQAPNGKLLEWQKPRAGRMMTWNEANDYVTESNRKGLMGRNGWRLPAVGELRDLAESIKNSPGSYSDTDKLYWSSEDLGPYSVQAKVVNLGNAQMERECFEVDQQAAKCSKNNRFSVRLVRSLIQ